MKRKKMLAIGLSVCISAAMLAGCGGTTPDSTEESAAEATTESAAETEKSENAVVGMVEGTVRIGTQYEWTNKNPYAEISGGADRNLRIIYEPVFDRERETGNLIPVLGKSYKEVDPYTMEVELYDYIHDSQGNPLTADDVVFSYEEMIAEGNYWTGYLIDSCTKVDDYTFQLKLRTARAGALETVLSKTPIVTKAAFESLDMSAEPVGTGHYVLDNYVSGSSWGYEVNNDYWQTEELTSPFSKANISNIEYKLYTETAQSSIALETGEIDVIEDVTSSEFYLFEEGGMDAETASLYEYASHFVTFLNYNCDPSDVFADQTLRQAVSTAIDQQSLLDAAYDGHGGICKTLAASSCVDFNDAWNNDDYYDYNLEKAKELLGEAGYGEGELTVRLLVDNYEQRIRMAQIIQANLADIGVTVEILTYDTALYNTYKYTTDQYDMYIETLNCDDYITTIWDSALNNTKYSDGGTISHYKDDKLQEYVVSAGSKETRTDELIDEARQYLYEVVPSYGLIYTSVSHVAVNSINDLTVNMSCYLQPGAFEYSSDF